MAKQKRYKVEVTIFEYVEAPSKKMAVDATIVAIRDALFDAGQGDGYLGVHDRFPKVDGFYYGSFSLHSGEWTAKATEVGDAQRD